MRQDAPNASRAGAARPWIPESTQRVLGNAPRGGVHSAAHGGDNLSLWLDCFSPFDDQGQLKGEQRVRWLEHFTGSWQSEAGREGLARLEKAVCAYHAPGADQPSSLVSLELTLQGRLLVGSGSGALETSLALHPLWSVPRIPASALKGLAHHALLKQRALAEAECREELKQLAQLERLLFGNTGDADAAGGGSNRPRCLTLEESLKSPTCERAGLLIFYDALPSVGRFELGLDVLTPHANAYYQGEQPPADYWSPVPVSYLTVVNTTFVTWVGIVPPVTDLDAELLNLGVALLKKALTEEGAGSRTRSGFGRFEVKTQQVELGKKEQGA